MRRGDLPPRDGSPSCWRSSDFMKRLATALSIALALAIPAVASATRMPVLAGVSGPLQVRPNIVDLSADGSELLGGVTGRHPHEDTPGHPFGRLHWTTWNSTEGRAWGAEWLNNCRPSCGAGTYYAYKATVHVYDPGRSGVFLRMTVKSRRSFRYSAMYVGGYGGGWVGDRRWFLSSVG